MRFVNYIIVSKPLSRVLSNLSNNSFISFSVIINGGHTAKTSPIALRIMPSLCPTSAKTGPVLPIGSNVESVFLSLTNSTAVSYTHLTLPTKA